MDGTLRLVCKTICRHCEAISRACACIILQSAEKHRQSPLFAEARYDEAQNSSVVVLNVRLVLETLGVTARMVEVEKVSVGVANRPRRHPTHAHTAAAARTGIAEGGSRPSSRTPAIY